MPGTLKNLVKRVPPVQVVAKAIAVIGIIMVLALFFILPNITRHGPVGEQAARDAEWEAIQTGLKAMLFDNAIATVIAHDESTSSIATNTWSALPAGAGARPLAGYLSSRSRATSRYFYCYDDKARISLQFDTAKACTKPTNPWYRRLF